MAELFKYPSGRETLATKELAAIFCRGARYGTSDAVVAYFTPNFQLPDPFSHTPGALSRIRQLLEAGADPNVITCVFQVDGRRLHRLMDADARADFFEAPYTAYFKETDWADRSQQDANSFMMMTRIPLFEAAYAGDMATASLLVKHGARIDTAMKNWYSNPRHYRSRMRIDVLRNPFDHAVNTNNYELLELLLKTANVKEYISRRWLGECMTIALDVDASATFHLEIATLLMKHDPNIYSIDLPRQFSLEVIDFIVRHGLALPIMRREGLELLTAAFIDHVELCTLVFNSGADPRAQDSSGLSVLHIATGNKSTDVCDVLISLGSDIHTRDVYGMSPILEAVYYGHREAVHLLLAKGASPSDKAQSKNIHPGACPPHKRLRGAWRDRRDAAVELFQRKQWSAIHIAAHRGFSIMIELLLKKGATINTVDNRGDTALDVALQNSHIATAYLLLSHDCPLNIASEAASAFLEIAIEECNRNAVRRLAEWGVQLRSQDGLQVRSLLEHEDAITTKLRTSLGLSLLDNATTPDPNTRFSGFCESCYTLLKTGKPVYTTWATDFSCNLCRIIRDYENVAGGSIQRLNYVNVDGAPDRKLVITYSSGGNLSIALRLITDDWHQVLQRLETLDDDDTGSPAATSMAAHWLRTCLQSHSQCNHQLSSQFSPTRVLDIHGLDDGHEPNLLQNVTLDSPYVALSHRWGTEGLPTTTSANLVERLRCIPLDELSKTMQDAIQVVKNLGFRYLWIDALCIIQDSTADWLKEASHMSQVFSGAIVTLAVADADSHAQGIFRPRMGYCVRPFRVPYLDEIPYRLRDHDGEGEFFVFPKGGCEGAGNRTKSTLDTRGWILQEQLLSTRVLYYGKGQIYWDCITVSASESSPLSASLLYDSDPDETWALKIVRRTLAGSTNNRTLRKKIADIWAQVIKNYSSRKLTRQSDKLMALEGILKPLENILQDEPVAGMWRDQLWRQLIWWVAIPNSSPSTDSSHPFSAPSWSWLSVSSPVYYHNALRGDDPPRDGGPHKYTDLEPLAEIIFAESETIPGASAIRGSLIIAGPSFHYRLTANDLKKPVFKSWNAAKLNLNTGKWMLDRAVQLPLDMQVVIVAEDAVAKMLVCFCLVSDKDQIDTWKRVGVCHWDGLAWQVSKYVGSELEERAFTIV